MSVSAEANRCLAAAACGAYRAREELRKLSRAGRLPAKEYERRCCRTIFPHVHLCFDMVMQLAHLVERDPYVSEAWHYPSAADLTTVRVIERMAYDVYRLMRVSHQFEQAGDRGLVCSHCLDPGGLSSDFQRKLDATYNEAAALTSCLAAWHRGATCSEPNGDIHRRTHAAHDFNSCSLDDLICCHAAEALAHKGRYSANFNASAVPWHSQSSQKLRSKDRYMLALLGTPKAKALHTKLSGKVQGKWSVLSMGPCDNALLNRLTEVRGGVDSAVGFIFTRLEHDMQHQCTVQGALSAVRRAASAVFGVLQQEHLIQDRQTCMQLGYMLVYCLAYLTHWHVENFPTGAASRACALYQQDECMPTAEDLLTHERECRSLLARVCNATVVACDVEFSHVSVTMASQNKRTASQALVRIDETLNDFCVALDLFACIVLDGPPPVHLNLTSPGIVGIAEHLNGKLKGAFRTSTVVGVCRKALHADQLNEKYILAFESANKGRMAEVQMDPMHA